MSGEASHLSITIDAPGAPAIAPPSPRRPAVRLPGDLTIPPDARGVVLFAHGSGSSRLSPRNRAVAATLHQARLATLLFDLLTEEESGDRRNVFDIPLLATRLTAAAAHIRTRPETHALPLCLFGASTGAAAALVAASTDYTIRAVVSRGGRPDLAGEALRHVRAPTLLIVGAEDHAVIQMNQDAAARLTACEHQLVLVPGATHLFEEPGTLEHAAGLACAWFAKHIAPAEA